MPASIATVRICLYKHAGSSPKRRERVGNGLIISVTYSRDDVKVFPSIGPAVEV